MVGPTEQRQGKRCPVRLGMIRSKSRASPKVLRQMTGQGPLLPFTCLSESARPGLALAGSLNSALTEDFQVRVNGGPGRMHELHWPRPRRRFGDGAGAFAPAAKHAGAGDAAPPAPAHLARPGASCQWLPGRAGPGLGRGARSLAGGKARPGRPRRPWAAASAVPLVGDRPAGATGTGSGRSDLRPARLLLATEQNAALCQTGADGTGAQTSSGSLKNQAEAAESGLPISSIFASTSSLNPVSSLAPRPTGVPAVN